MKKTRIFLAQGERSDQLERPFLFDARRELTIVRFFCVLFWQQFRQIDVSMNIVRQKTAFLVKNAPFHDEKYKKTIDELGKMLYNKSIPI